MGDEPLQFKKKFPALTVAVCEDRKTGIEILQDNATAILLDDAFQHRKVKASLNIVLTPFNNLYVYDCMLPSGDLREPKSGAKRADIIVVTKCPENLSEETADAVKQRLEPTANQQVYFSKIGYAADIKNEAVQKPLSYLKERPFHLVTGIALPVPLISYLNGEGLQFTESRFPDHHNFTNSELEELKKHPLILTTEKDFMRLQSLSKAVEIYYLPIKTVILNGEEEAFKNSVLKGMGSNF